MSGLKSEITSYSDSAYMTLPIFCCCFWYVVGLYSIPGKFHCCQTPNGRVKLGGGGLFYYRDIPDRVQNRVKTQNPFRPKVYWLIINMPSCSFCFCNWILPWRVYVLFSADLPCKFLRKFRPWSHFTGSIRGATPKTISDSPSFCSQLIQHNFCDDYDLEWFDSKSDMFHVG